jgi:hypothetical protein
MGIDVSAQIGSPQVAGTQVSPRGAGKQAMAWGAGTAGGLIPAVIGAAAGQKAAKDAVKLRAESETPQFGRLGFLALTDGELALVKMKPGLVSPKPVEVIARVQRSDIASIELGGGFPTVPLTVAFTNGETWSFEVPRLASGNAKELVSLLGGE